MVDFPTDLDSFTNPTGTDYLDGPDHPTQHTDENDAIEALEVKVGKDSSTDNTSHDYKLSGVADGDKAVSKTGTETLTNKTLTSPTCTGTDSGTETLNNKTLGATTMAGNLDMATYSILQAYLASPHFTGSIDGWISADETWAYASATTITVPAGATSKYSAGDKIKLNQSIPLSAYWPLSDKDEDIIPATTTEVGVPTYTAGKFGNALTLATDKALAVTDATVFKPTGAFTFGFWFKSNHTGAVDGMFSSESVNANFAGFECFIYSDNKIYFQCGNNTAAANYDLVVSTTSVHDNAWHYLVITYRANQVKMYIDGALEINQYITFTPAYAATNYVRIGCANRAGTDNNFMTGQIDDLFFINGYDVTTAWVAAKYAAATAQGTSAISTTQYAYVSTVADTLLTIIGNVVTNNAITDNYYSHNSSPVGMSGSRMIGYSQSIKAQAGITTITDITNCSATVIVPPGGGRVKITGFSQQYSSVAGDTLELGIYEGTTKLNSANMLGGYLGTTAFAILTPSAGTHTYKLTMTRAIGSGSVTINNFLHQISSITVEYYDY